MACKPRYAIIHGLGSLDIRTWDKYDPESQPSCRVYLMLVEGVKVAKRKVAAMARIAPPLNPGVTRSATGTQLFASASSGTKVHENASDEHSKDDYLLDDYIAEEADAHSEADYDSDTAEEDEFQRADTAAQPPKPSSQRPLSVEAH
jgi:hypothetical protein